MKRAIILGLFFIMTLAAFSPAKAQKTNFKTWKITVSESGGFAGINKSYTVYSGGILFRSNKNQENSEKIDDAKLAEIAKLLKELNLPGTKLQTVKGKRIFDGIYRSLVITLDGKDYKVEGTSFEDAKYLRLSKRQQATLEKLKAKLDELGGFLPDSMNNK